MSSSDGPAIPTVPGPETFDALEAREPLTVARQAALAGGSVYTPAADFVIGDVAIRAEVERLGFRWLGCYQFTGRRSKRPLVREAWVDPLGVVRLSLRRALTADRVEGRMSLYYLSSTFDDGVEITTWGKKAPLASTPRIQERDGSGDIATDYASHLAAVRDHAAHGPRAVTFPDLATVIRAGHWDHFHLSPGRRRTGAHGALDAVTRLIVPWVTPGLRVLVVVAILIWIYRMIRR